MPETELAIIKRRSLVGAISYFLRTLVLQGIGFISIIVLSKFFSPEDFGIYGIVIQIIGILIFFSDIGLAASLIQKKAEPTKKDLQTVFAIQQILSWLIVGAVVLLSQLALIQNKLGPDGTWVLYALAISFPLATLKTIPSVILERKLEFSKLVLPQIFEQLVFHSILIYLAWNGVGVLAYAYAVIARSIIGVIVMSLIQPWPFGIRLDKKSLLGLINFGVKFQLNDFLARVKDQLFYLTLGLVIPTRQFGYIQWAKSWSMYPYNLTVQNVLAITFPSFSRLQHNKAALAKAIEKSLFFITLVIFPIIVGMSLFIIPLLTLIPDYQKWLPAAASLILFSASIAWGAVSTPLTNTLNAIGQINQTLKLMLLWTTLTWILTPVLYVLLGFNGVAWAALLISFTSALSVYYVQKAVSFSFLDQVWRQTLASLVMVVLGLFGWQYWQQGFTQLLTGMLLVGASYPAVLLLIGKDKILSEINLILAIVRRKGTA